jgi:hypothetical protein
MRDRPDRQVVDAGLGVRARRLQRQPAADLEPGAPTDGCDRLLDLVD